MPKAKIVRKIDVESKSKRPSAPRKPARDRGLLRYDLLVEATEFLLQAEDPDEVGLYRIAEQAGVPPASVYHFFPTKEAAFTALAIRITDQLFEVHRSPIPARNLQTWQDLFRIDAGRARDFYNQHPAALKIFYGGYGGVNARRVDEAVSTRIAHAAYNRMNRLYHMPFIRDPAKKFTCRMAMLDSVWAVSVQRQGYISDEYHEEALTACIAYSGSFFPNQMELREEFRAQIEADALIHIPFDQLRVSETDETSAYGKPGNDG